MWTDEPARDGCETLPILGVSTVVVTGISPEENPPVRWEALATVGNAGAKPQEAYGTDPSGQTCEAIAT